MSVTSDLDLRAMLRDFLREHPSADRFELADDFIAQLDEDLYEELLYECLPDTISGELTRLRATAKRTASRPGSDRVARQRRAHLRGDLAAYRVLAGGVQKNLLDCTRADLAAAASYHETKAAAELHTAEKYRKLSALMEQHGFNVVSDLGIDRIAEVIGA